jgi:hypothetical protein
MSEHIIVAALIKQQPQEKTPDLPRAATLKQNNSVKVRQHLIERGYECSVLKACV